MENKTLFNQNKPMKITSKKLDLLYFFCTNINQNITYDTLKENVWENSMISHSTIRDTVARLKRKIPELPLENIINFGYILKLDTL
jgi:two-component system response regulator CssR